MQIRTIQTRFRMHILNIEKDSNHSNANLNRLNEIWNIRMQILTIWKGFKAFECKF